MPPSIENLCPDFLAFWEQARDKPVEEQEGLWHALYELPHRELLEIYFTFFGSRSSGASVCAGTQVILPKSFVEQ
jgi:hypothetical protein